MQKSGKCNLIGVLTGSGGVADEIKSLAKLSKNTGSVVLYNPDPEVLINELLEKYNSGEYICPCNPSAPAKEQIKSCGC